MLELSRISDAGLMDLLVTFTNTYSSLLTNRDYNADEYDQCKEIIKRIQEEVEYRRQASRIH